MLPDILRRRILVPPAYQLTDSNPLLYLPASAAYVYKEGAGTPPGSTLVTAVGDRVGAHRDIGSLAAHFKQTDNNLRSEIAQLAALRNRFNGSNRFLAGPQTIAVTGSQVLVFKFRFNVALASGSFCCPISLRGPAGFALIWIDNGSSFFAKKLNFYLGGAYSSGSINVAGCDFTIDTNEYIVSIERTAPGTGANAANASEYTKVKVNGVSKVVTASATGIASRTAGDPSALGGDYYSGAMGRYSAIDLGGVFYLDRPYNDASEETNVYNAFVAA